MEHYCHEICFLTGKQRYGTSLSCPREAPAKVSSFHPSEAPATYLPQATHLPSALLDPPTHPCPHYFPKVTPTTNLHSLKAHTAVEQKGQQRNQRYSGKACCPAGAHRSNQRVQVQLLSQNCHTSCPIVLRYFFFLVNSTSIVHEGHRALALQISTSDAVSTPGRRESQRTGLQLFFGSVVKAGELKHASFCGTIPH